MKMKIRAAILIAVMLIFSTACYWAAEFIWVLGRMS